MSDDERPYDTNRMDEGGRLIMAMTQEQGLDAFAGLMLQAPHVAIPLAISAITLLQKCIEEGINPHFIARGGAGTDFGFVYFGTHEMAQAQQKRMEQA
jgi:hypothetical protein